MKVCEGCTYCYDKAHMVRGHNMYIGKPAMLIADILFEGEARGHVNLGGV